MSEIETIPESWSTQQTPEQGVASRYSIEEILPPGKRRFLQLREPFMVLCNNFPVRAAVLECARFEMERRFRFTASGEKPDLEWQEEQHRILLGPNPEKADLWAPFPAERIISRVCGMTTNKNSIGQTIKWLESAGYLFTGKTTRPRNGRTVMLNLKQIERDLRDSEFYEGVDFRPAVKGHPDQFMVEPEPEAQVFIPLYEGLSELVVAASSEPKANMETARAAMLLHRILVRAQAREKAGEEIAVAWSHSHIHASFGWGDHRTWKAALARLTTSNLVTKVGTEHSAPVVAPNLSRILYFTRGIAEAKPSPNVEHRFNRGRTQIDPKKQTEVPDEVIPPGKSGTQIRPNTPALRTEGFSESLSEYLSERKAVGDFDAVSILGSHSISNFEIRRTTFFVSLPVEESWSKLTFDHLAKGDSELAAAALELSKDLGAGVRPAIAFPANSKKSRATIAVLIGDWIDRHVTEKPVEWLKIDSEVIDVIKGDYRIPEENRARADLLAKLHDAEAPLIIESLAMAGRNEQLRDELVFAIRCRADNLTPIVFLELPDTVAELRKSLKDDRLTDLVVRVLAERNTPFEIPEVAEEIQRESSDPENPFL